MEAARIMIHPSYNEDGYTSNLSLAKARMSKSDVINPVVTFLQGNEQKLFPLLFLTEGQMKGVQWKGIEDVEYEWPIFGKLKNTSEVVSHAYTGVTSVGSIQGEEIMVVFKDAFLKFQHNVVSPNNVWCRVIRRPVKVANGYLYALQLVKNASTPNVPIDEIKAGTKWAMIGAANVSEAYSVGNESNRRTPGKAKNQIGIIRKSYEFAGNVGNRTVEYLLPTKNGTTKLWQPFEEYEHEMNFKRSCEESLWESQYNRDNNGNILTIDPDTGLPIPYGAGLKAQIPNKGTYSILTFKKINKIISDIFYGASDKQNVNVVLFTGTSGKEEFSNAIMTETKSWTIYQGALNSTITGSPMNLTFGAAFTHFRHIDGHMVSVVTMPYLDHSGYADKSPLHYTSGRPLSSYEMHFVDMSTYDGENNVQLVNQKGRSMVRGIEQGMTLLKGSSGDFSDYAGNGKDLVVSTSQDKSAVHFLKTLGVAIRRNTHCFSLFCDAAA